MYVGKVTILTIKRLAGITPEVNHNECITCMPQCKSIAHSEGEDLNQQKNPKMDLCLSFILFYFFLSHDRAWLTNMKNRYTNSVNSNVNYKKEAFVQCSKTE